MAQLTPLILLATCSLFFLLCLVSYTRTAPESNIRGGDIYQAVTKRPEDDDGVRPYIYRFQTSKEESNIEKKIAEIWHRVWKSAGWTPLTLNLWDTINKNDYDVLKADIEQAKLAEDQANQIWKFVAMSAVGGGFLSHTDVFPLQLFAQKHGSFLPNEGRLTIYDDMTSSLVSGRGAEWMWMARLLAKHALAYKGREWSEKIALQDLYSPDTMEVQKDMHHINLDGTRSFRMNPNECSLAQDKRAVHFELGIGERFYGQVPKEDLQVVKWLADFMGACEEKDKSLEPVQKQQLAGGQERSAEFPVIYRFDPDAEVADDNIRKVKYAWQLTWENAGWEPMTLNVMNYADLELYQDIKENLDRSVLNYQQKRHIWKYVAMSAVGGGFVAQCDTFPMHSFSRQGKNLPNNGRLTLYDDRFPSLMSGSSEEWLKVARIMSRYARSYREKEPWTEALALQQQWLYSNSVALQTEVLRVGNELITQSTWEWSSSDCKRESNKRAVHFAIDDLTFAGVEDPGSRIVAWLSSWLNSCPPSTQFQTNY